MGTQPKGKVGPPPAPNGKRVATRPTTITVNGQPMTPGTAYLFVCPYCRTTTRGSDPDCRNCGAPNRPILVPVES